MTLVLDKSLKIQAGFVYPGYELVKYYKFQLLEKYYHQHKISALEFIPFLKMCKAMCKVEELKWHGPLSPATRRAVKSQQTLGEEFFLRGYLTVDWLAAIKKTP